MARRTRFGPRAVSQTHPNVATRVSEISTTPMPMILRHLTNSRSIGFVAKPALQPQNARLFRTMREPTYRSLQDEFSVDDIEEFQGDDTTAVGHGLLRQQREVLDMFRKIETEMPMLQGMPMARFGRSATQLTNHFQPFENLLSHQKVPNMSYIAQCGTEGKSIQLKRRPSSFFRYPSFLSPKIGPSISSNSWLDHAGV